MNTKFIFSAIIIAFAQIAVAIPYDCEKGSVEWRCSPSNYDNNFSNWENGRSNWKNSSSAWENSPSNSKNSHLRRAPGQFHPIFNQNGTVNIFKDGERDFTDMRCFNMHWSTFMISITI